MNMKMSVLFSVQECLSNLSFTLSRGKLVCSHAIQPEVIGNAISYLVVTIIKQNLRQSLGSSLLVKGPSFYDVDAGGPLSQLFSICK